MINRIGEIMIRGIPVMIILGVFLTCASTTTTIHQRFNTGTGLNWLSLVLFISFPAAIWIMGWLIVWIVATISELFSGKN